MEILKSPWENFSFDAHAPPSFAATLGSIREELGLSLESGSNAGLGNRTDSLEDMQSFEPALSAHGTMSTNSVSNDLEEPSEHKDLNPSVDSWSRTHYIAMMRLTLQDRRAFVDKGGKLGVAYQDIRVGDIVALLLGADVPVILRPQHNGTHFQSISEAFVHG